MSRPKNLIRFFLGVLLAWIASAPVGAQTNASSPCPYRFLGLQLAPGQYLVRHALALPARPPRKPDR